MVIAVVVYTTTAVLVAATTNAQQAYLLGPGDQLRVNVYEEDDVSGEFEISDQGHISLPLIGPVQATGITLQELEKRVRLAFQDGYIRDPKISIEVLNYRPFYVIGEVNAPGSYPYRSGLSVLTAVAMGGGYTFRADEDDITVKRAGTTSGDPIKVSPDTIILPGDVVRVGERLW